MSALYLWCDGRDVSGTVLCAHLNKFRFMLDSQQQKDVTSLMGFLQCYYCIDLSHTANLAVIIHLFNISHLSIECVSEKDSLLCFFIAVFFFFFFFFCFFFWGGGGGTSFLHQESDMILRYRS